MSPTTSRSYCVRFTSAASPSRAATPAPITGMMSIFLYACSTSRTAEARKRRLSEASAAESPKKAATRSDHDGNGYGDGDSTPCAAAHVTNAPAQSSASRTAASL